MSDPLPSEADEARHRSLVTYQYSQDDVTQNIKLWESRSLISGLGTTGFRTWEAALNLGNYFLSCSPEAARWTSGKTVLELGAGTGFLSILSAQSLKATRVICTDGSEEMVSLANENVLMNPANLPIETMAFQWGSSIQPGLLYDLAGESGVDTVIGADVVSEFALAHDYSNNRQTYDQRAIPALVTALRQLFEVWPKLDAIISATIRNEDTFNVFRNACSNTPSCKGFINLD